MNSDGATQLELAQHVRYLTIENEILRSKLPKRVPLTVTVGPCIDLIIQHRKERVPVRPIPFQMATVRTANRTKGKADAVLSQLAQQRVDRPLPHELGEDQPHNGLGLFLRIELENSSCLR